MSPPHPPERGSCTAQDRPCRGDLGQIKGHSGLARVKDAKVVSECFPITRASGVVMCRDRGQRCNGPPSPNRVRKPLRPLTRVN